MSDHEIANRITPLPEREFILTAAKAWKRFYGRGPKGAQLACCLAQMILEIGRKKDPSTGQYTWGAYCHNFNMGNIKSRPNDGSHWQYYDCGEEVSLKEAQRLVAKDPALVEIRKQYKWSNGTERASIWLKAPHPWCRFRAYETAEDGLVDYIDFLVSERVRYLTAWNEGVLKGDPVTFSKELGKAGYYTADVDRYTKTVVALFTEFEGKVKGVLESPEGREIYEAEDDLETQRAMDFIGVSVQMSIASDYESLESLDEEDARMSQNPNVSTRC
jgi:hypothetical protein